jgi:hypothetical protein
MKSKVGTVKTSSTKKKSPLNKPNVPHARARGTPAKPGSKAPTSWHAEFLKVLQLDGRVYRACEVAGVSRVTAYEHKKQFADFSHAWDAVVDRFLDNAEAELYRRAVMGWEEPVYQGGEEVGTVRKHSDKCLEMLLKGRRRDVYGDQVKVTGTLKTPPSDEEVAARSSKFESGIIATMRAAAMAGPGPEGRN